MEAIRQRIGKQLGDWLISLAGYVGGYNLINPTDKHGVKHAKLLCKGKIICIPFYHSGQCCQVFLDYNRSQFDEVAYGVLFPDGRILDISTGCPGMNKPVIDPENFGPQCKLIHSHTLHKFPNHVRELGDSDIDREDTQAEEEYTQITEEDTQITEEEASESEGMVNNVDHDWNEGDWNEGMANKVRNRWGLVDDDDMDEFRRWRMEAQLENGRI